MIYKIDSCVFWFTYYLDTRYVPCNKISLMLKVLLYSIFIHQHIFFDVFFVLFDLTISRLYLDDTWTMHFIWRRLFTYTKKNDSFIAQERETLMSLLRSYKLVRPRMFRHNDARWVIANITRVSPTCIARNSVWLLQRVRSSIKV